MSGTRSKRSLPGQRRRRRRRRPFRRPRPSLPISPSGRAPPRPSPRPALPAAASHYHKALALDPRNAPALAALAALTDFPRPEAIESQLRGDVARYPQSAALRFTLGNLYAPQGRWSEAQLEYFEAHRLDPASADIVLNLAVSLDHLGQRRVASEYYRRALAAARTQATQFDPVPVERRIAELGFEPAAAGR